jgi:fructose-1,6-bisphosphatase I
MTDPIMTVSRFLYETQRRLSPEATGTLTMLLSDVILAAKLVSREVNKAGLLDILGTTGETNVQGETVQKLDEYANRTFMNCLSHGRQIAALVSEEMEGIYFIKSKTPLAKYVLTLDPLDGSSNIDVNVSIGSIFSVYKRMNLHQTQVLEEDFLQHGRKQVAAGYVVYGSSTMLVLTVGEGTHGFTLDPSVGEFLLSHPNIRIPEKGKYYSVNEASAHEWLPEVREYVEDLKNPVGGGYSGRYIGSLVADFHRNLLKGGVFCYPGSQRGDKVQGKLRLLYEANPLAFVLEQAGGMAVDGGKAILDLKPETLHQRVPLYMGSKQEMQVCLAKLQKKKRTPLLKTRPKPISGSKPSASSRPPPSLRVH